MKNGLRYRLLGAAACIAPLAHASPARAAGTLTVTSISPNAFALGRIGAAHSNNGGSGGDTTFTFSPTSNSVTVVPGGGGTAAHTTSTAPFIVTVKCANGTNCTNDQGKIVILTPTGRTNNPALSNFTYGSAGGSGITPTIAGTLTYTLPNITAGQSKTFGIGMDFTVNGDEVAGSTTSASTAAFQVYAGTTASPTSSATATISATIYRGISIVQTSSMQFGRIARAAGGAGNVILGPGSDTVTTSSTSLVPAPGPSFPTSRGLFTIYGEGGQAFTLSVPTSFVMTQSSHSLTVTTNPSFATGTHSFSGATGAYGTLSLGIGGTVALTASTTLGSYTGTFQITAIYN